VTNSAMTNSPGTESLEPNADRLRTEMIEKND
jgi:hypothetical protein